MDRADILASAVQAKLPLIAIRTDDPLSIESVLKHITKQKFKPLQVAVTKGGNAYIFNEGFAWAHASEIKDEYLNLYGSAQRQKAIVVLLNPEEIHWTMFDAGTIRYPDEMLREFIKEYVEDEDREGAFNALRGLSGKAFTEICRMSCAQYGDMSPQSLFKVRRERMILSSGLKLVDTEQLFYEPPPEITDWLQVDGALFKKELPVMLQARGLLFTGPPGTGKTSGAKFLSKSLNLPLFYVDVGSLLGRYVGDSEGNLRNVLLELEELAPCVILLDEIEKLFNGHSDSGVIPRMLSMLLWWLQEHTSKVLTIMTTNAEGEIPAELIRPGRIDHIIRFKGLHREESISFGQRLAHTVDSFYKLTDQAITEVVDSQFSEGTSVVSQAALTGAVYHEVKRQMVGLTKE